MNHLPRFSTHPATRWRAAPARPPRASVGGQIAAFLDGRTHGEELLHALYDDVLDEPIPDAMRALLNRE